MLYRVNPNGTLDTTFGVNGIFHKAILTAQTEAYGAAVQGTKYVTVGYGRNLVSESTDIVSIRLLPNGTLDPTYGTAGFTRIDVAGYADNGRSILVLPDNRVVLVGGGRATEQNVDGFVAILTPDGQRDTSFSPTGFKLFDLGGPSDFLQAVALSTDKTKIASSDKKVPPRPPMLAQ